MSKLNPHWLLQQLALTPDQQVVLALSGGLDSMVLLHLLALARAEQPFALQAVYIHHGISQHASAWGEFCAQQCAARQVAFSQRNVSLKGKDNLEFKARNARYGALAEFIVSARHVLLTAHHGDDQFESLLLALKRGTGAAGMGGMKPARSFAAGQLLRPLLGVSRQQLQQYATTHQLSWVEDDSNADMRFERNFIRSQVTPLLSQRWPHFISSVGRSLENIQQLQQLLDDYSTTDFQRCIAGDTLLLPELLKLTQAQQNYIVRRWLKHWQLNPSLQWLQVLQREVIAAREDASPALQLEHYQLRRFADALYVLTTQQCQPVKQHLVWHKEAEVILAQQGGVLHFATEATAQALPLSDGKVEVVFGQLSLRFKPYNSAHSKPLKQWFKLWRVPPWQRLRIPLLLVDGQLLLVAGYSSAVAPAHASYWVSWQS